MRCTVYRNLQVIIFPPQNFPKHIFAYLLLGVGSGQDQGDHGLAHLTEHCVAYAALSAVHGNTKMSVFGLTELDFTLFRFCVDANRSQNFTYNLLPSLFHDNIFTNSILEKAKRSFIQERKMKVASERLSLYEALYSTAFRRHPYKRFNFGDEKIARRVTLKRVKDKFCEYFSAAKPVLIVFGSISKKSLEPLAEIFSRLSLSKKGRIAAQLPSAKVSVRNGRDVKWLRTSDAYWQMLIGYPAPPDGDRDRISLMVFSEVLMSSFFLGKIDWLGKNERLIPHLPVTRYDSLYEIYVQFDKSDPASFERQLHRRLLRLSSDLPQSVFDEMKRRVLRRLRQDKRNEELRALRLGCDILFHNNIQYGSGIEKAVRNLSREAFCSVIEKTIHPNNSTVIFGGPSNACEKQN